MQDGDIKMNEPLVTVIIPCWGKYVDYLPRCLKSVNKQTYKNIEILIIGNLKDSANAACNAGMLRAKGEYLAFLGADDTWERDKIRLQVNTMELNPNCILCTTWSKDHRFGKVRISKPPISSNHTDILRAFNYSSGSTYMIRAYEGIFFDEKLVSGQEYDFALRITEKYNSVALCVPRVLVTQHSTEGQISTNWSKKVKGIWQLANRHWREYSIIDWVKVLGLTGIYISGFIFGDRIYKLITYMKERHE